MSNASSAVPATLVSAAQSRGWFATLRLRLAALIAGSDLHRQTSAELQSLEQLVESHSRVLALREQLANAEQVRARYPPGCATRRERLRVGMWNGKLSALRWVLGEDWDFLDT